MSAIIYTILKELYVEIHGHGVKARIMSPINSENSFTFQINAYFKKSSDGESNIPSAMFTSYANAERHLLSYLEDFQNTLDLGGEIAVNTKF
ncbi:hypothetical protein [Pedobacter sandarakinus]|uniref:hypothetical protein n=1 Tax=Pedobacter sandarakinus TaxID=353156 RepID=UPI0022462865|nr:hypothetical protein [Pedobacter sandarakinus]MCX2574710.1 hypothetical protein [Pedobacter sandarakinus]